MNSDLKHMHSEELYFEILRKYSVFLSIALSSLVLLYPTAVGQVSVAYFHIAYLLSLGCLSIHLVDSMISRRGTRLSILTAIWVMVCFRLLTTTSVPYPIIADTDSNYELQNVNAILSSGGIPWGQGTGFAFGYSYFPGLEIIVSMFSTVSLIPATALVKYMGSFLGIFTIALFLRFYLRTDENHQGQGNGPLLAAVFAAFSPWFIAFDTLMNHEAVAFVLLGMLLLSLSEKRRGAWVTIAVLATIVIVITHAFTSYVVLFLLLLLFARRYTFGRETSNDLPNLGPFVVTLAITIIFAWAIFTAISYIPDMLGYVSAVTEVLLFPKLNLITVSPSGTKPMWVVALTYAGFATYLLIAISSFYQTLHDKGSRKLKSWLAFGGFLIAGLLITPYLADLPVDTATLMGRGITYLYFLTAPSCAVSTQVMQAESQTPQQADIGGILDFHYSYSRCLLRSGSEHI